MTDWRKADAINFCCFGYIANFQKWSMCIASFNSANHLFNKGHPQINHATYTFSKTLRQLAQKNFLLIHLQTLIWKFKLHFLSSALSTYEGCRGFLYGRTLWYKEFFSMYFSTLKLLSCLQVNFKWWIRPSWCKSLGNFIYQKNILSTYFEANFCDVHQVCLVYNYLENKIPVTTWSTSLNN